MKVLLAALLISSGISIAAPTIYQKQNFSIEFPEGWQKADPPPESVALLRSPDGAKGVVIMAFKVPADQRATALEKMVSGAKSGAREKGIEIRGEQDLDINGAAFQTHSFTLPGNVVTVSNMAVEGEWGYSVQAFSASSDPTSDAEIQQMIHSFRLLTPVTADTSSVKGEVLKSDAYNAGQLTAKIAIIAFVVGAVILLLLKLVRGKKA